MVIAVSRVELQYHPLLRWLSSHLTSRGPRSSSGLIVTKARRKNAFDSISLFHQYHQLSARVSTQTVSFSGSSFKNCSALRNTNRASSLFCKFHNANASKLFPYTLS